MFVLVSMSPKMNPSTRSMEAFLFQQNEECVVGVFATKELAVNGISSYAGTSNAGKRALIYEMLPDGDKQKRVKIYEGSFPLCAPKISSNQEPIAHTFQLKLMRERIQKLEEKLESKCAEYNRLKISSNQEPIAHTFQLKLMRERIQKLEEKLESKCAECNRLKIDNSEMTTMINRMKDLIQV